MTPKTRSSPAKATVSKKHRRDEETAAPRTVLDIAAAAAKKTLSKKSKSPPAAQEPSPAQKVPSVQETLDKDREDLLSTVQVSLHGWLLILIRMP